MDFNEKVGGWFSFLSLKSEPWCVCLLLSESELVASWGEPLISQCKTTAWLAGWLLNKYELCLPFSSRVCVEFKIQKHDSSKINRGLIYPPTVPQFFLLKIPDNGEKENKTTSLAYLAWIAWDRFTRNPAKCLFWTLNRSVPLLCFNKGWEISKIESQTCPANWSKVKWRQNIPLQDKGCLNRRLENESSICCLLTPLLSIETKNNNNKKRSIFPSWWLIHQLWRRRQRPATPNNF